MSKKQKQEFSLHYALAGSLSGITQKTLVQPLDLVKTRMQVQDKGSSAYTGLRQGFRSIVQNEGYAALYTGLAPNLLGSGVSWGVYFQVYHTAKRMLRQRTGQVELSAPLNFLSATMAGVTTALVCNPIWMVKTRLQIQQENPLKRANGAALTAAEAALMKPYTGTIDAFSRIVKEEGIFALYRGIGPALSLVSNQALQFMFYEELKSGYKKYVQGIDPAAVALRKASSAEFDSDSESSLNSIHFLVMGATAKFMSTTITYPLQVLRARMFRRDMPANTSMLDVTKFVHSSLGVRGFYQGFVPYVTKTCISSALTFGAFENLLKVFDFMSTGVWRGSPAAPKE